MQPKNTEYSSVDLNNLFYLYRREVQSIPLLSKEDELILHQAIETHLQAILKVCTEAPECLEVIRAYFEKILAGKLKLEVLIYGFTPLGALQLKPDLEEIKQRLGKLFVLQYEVQGGLIQFGPEDCETQISQQRLLESLSGFKWTEEVIDTLARYLQANKLPPFQRVNKAFIAFKQAKNALVASNLRLVVFMARKYTNGGAPFLDLLQEGNIGLIQAVERFDYRWGYAFSTYASMWIKHAILNALPKLQLAPTEGEEALENVEDEETPIPIEEISIQDLCKLTGRALSSLPPREADILRLRFGIGGPRPHTLDEIGQAFNVSRERIRQIEAKALKALRDQVQALSLNIFLNKG